MKLDMASKSAGSAGKVVYKLSSQNRDRELACIKAMHEALDGLSSESRSRVLTWVTQWARYEAGTERFDFPY